MAKSIYKRRCFKFMRVPSEMAFAFWCWWSATMRKVWFTVVISRKEISLATFSLSSSTSTLCSMRVRRCWMFRALKRRFAFAAAKVQQSWIDIWECSQDWRHRWLVLSAGLTSSLSCSVCWRSEFFVPTHRYVSWRSLWLTCCQIGWLLSTDRSLTIHFSSWFILHLNPT